MTMKRSEWKGQDCVDLQTETRWLAITVDPISQWFFSGLLGLRLGCLAVEKGQQVHHTTTPLSVPHSFLSRDCPWAYSHLQELIWTVFGMPAIKPASNIIKHRKGRHLHSGTRRASSSLNYSLPETYTEIIRFTCAHVASGQAVKLGRRWILEMGAFFSENRKGGDGRVYCFAVLK